MPMNLSLNLLYVGIGGAVGACCRYSLSLLLAMELTRFPVATLYANLIGAFVAGAVATWFWSRGLFGTPMQLIIIVGFLGGFTTFSAFSVETLRLLEGGQHSLALVNILTNVIGSLVAVFAGAALVRWIWAG